MSQDDRQTRPSASRTTIATDHDGWSESAERRWIQWTVLVSLLWAARYLAVPTARSLWHFATKIARL